MIIHSWNHSVWNSDMVFFLFYFCTNRNASEKMWPKCNLCEEKTFKNKTFIYNFHKKIRDEQNTTTIIHSFNVLWPFLCPSNVTHFHSQRFAL